MLHSEPRILIAGGGYGGMHTAPRLERLLRPGEATVMVADPRSYMSYQPLPAETAAGNLMTRRLRVVSGWTLAPLFRREVISLDVLEHPRQDFRAALRVIATGPPRATPFPGQEEKEDDRHAYYRRATRTPPDRGGTAGHRPRVRV